jgi:phosphoglycolate phosphatase-like HAD superfamily hydrolase
MSAVNALLEVSEDVEKQLRLGQRVAVVFDLDSTLFCVSPRTQAILRELGGDADFSRRFSEAAALLRGIEVLPTDYSVRRLLQRYPLTATEELGLAIRDYWHQHFFSDRHLDKDILYPSANEYVSHLHALGAQILYLTGRADSRMRAGTVAALRRFGFPEFEDSWLYMKPSEAESDEHFKVTQLKELVREYDYLWFFENEPLIIHEVRAALPQVRVVFVQSVHSGKAPEPEGLLTVVPDYSRHLWRR